MTLHQPDPESLSLIRELFQRLALVTGTLTEIEMLYEVPDAKFWEVAPLIRPDVVSYFAWMVDCGAVGKMDVFCLSFRFWWSYKEDLLAYPEENRDMVPWALFPHMTEQHPTKKLKRARIIVYDIARDGRAILAYLRACEARQVEQMQGDLDFLVQETADAFFLACRNGGKSAKEAAEILKADPEIETDGIWKHAFNRAYQDSKQNEKSGN